MLYNWSHYISSSKNIKTKIIMFGTQKMMKYNDFLLVIGDFIIETVNA